MLKKIVIYLIVILLVGTAMFVAKRMFSANFLAEKKDLEQMFREFKVEYERANVLGYNVVEAKNFAEKAKIAFESRQYRKAKEFLNEAFNALEKLNLPSKSATPQITTTPLPSSDSVLTPSFSPFPSPFNNPPQSKEEAKAKFSQINVVSQYRYATDGINGRKISDVAKIFKETQTDFIFQGINRQNPLPDSCSSLPKAQQDMCKASGYSAEYFKNSIAEIKAEMPNIIFGGGFLAEFLDPDSRNEITGKTYTRDELWMLAADPSNWGINKSKEEFQTEMAVRFGWTKQGAPYDPKEQMHYYFPDITNQEVKEIFLSWAKKQIDIGVDSLWIDGLYGQAELFEGITGDINHKAVKDSYGASSGIIDEIHKYGLSKGKYIYVISWARTMMLEAPYFAPDFDGVMITIGTEEIRNLKMNEKKWDGWKAKIKEVWGDVPIFARIDYGNVGSPLAVFSQEITKAQANQFLKIADEFLQKKNIKFIYPIHGGNMGKIGQKGKTLAYGKYDWYDALAPEFGTYETIKELALQKSK